MCDLVSKPMASLAKRDNNLQLKIQAAEAKVCWRQGKYFSSRIARGHLKLDTLLPSEQELVTKFNEGTLLREANAAVLAHGHGTLRDEQGSVTEMGGSTGGFTREFFDHYSPPDTAVWSRIKQ